MSKEIEAAIAAPLTTNNIEYRAQLIGETLREKQVPYAWEYMPTDGLAYPAYTKREAQAVAKGVEGSVIPLYAAPPAPAVPDAYLAPARQEHEWREGNWKCDAWKIVFTRTDRPALRFDLDYSRGVGHRKHKPSSSGGHPSLKGVRKGTLAYEEWEARKVAVEPHPAGPLYSVIMDDPRGEGFEGWCSNFGYDTDSRKALDIYLRCQANTERALKFFGHDLLARLAEILTEY